MSQSLSTLQMQVLAAMHVLVPKLGLGTNDMGIGDYLKDRGIDLTYRNSSYPVVCLTLGRLRKLGLVKRTGQEEHFGNWSLTEEGRFLAEGVPLP